jgi:hypothetical protein
MPAQSSGVAEALNSPMVVADSDSDSGGSIQFLNVSRPSLYFAAAANIMVARADSDSDSSVDFRCRPGSSSSAVEASNSAVLAADVAGRESKLGLILKGAGPMRQSPPEQYWVLAAHMRCKKAEARQRKQPLQHQQALQYTVATFNSTNVRNTTFVVTDAKDCLGMKVLITCGEKAGTHR